MKLHLLFMLVCVLRSWKNRMDQYYNFTLTQKEFFILSLTWLLVCPRSPPRLSPPRGEGEVGLSSL